MPGLNGLELIRRVKDAFPQAEVMIISGYAQFDYAQQALRNGVGEYLLKPINREALNRTLEKMADAIRERQRNDSAMQSIQAAGREDWGRLRRQTAADLWRGSGAPASLEELRRHHFRTDGDSFQTFLLKADIDAVENPDRFLQLVFQKARELLAPLLKKSCVDAVLYEAGDTLLGVVCLSSGEESALRSQLRSALNQLVAQKACLERWSSRSVWAKAAAILPDWAHP
ncbi:MAG: response regulator [Lachnospiraceae bacterium]